MQENIRLTGVSGGIC